MEAYKLKRVDRNELYSAWFYFEELFEETEDLWCQEDTIESIFQKLESGHYQLWVLLDRVGHSVFALMTRVVKTSRRDVLEVIWATGANSERAVLSIESLEAAARINNCGEVRVLGRPGWLKLLRPFGYAPAFHVIAKVIEGPGKEH